MAYKDYTGNDKQSVIDEQLGDEAMFFSRPVILPGGAFGALNFFFDPSLINPKEIEVLGSMVADFLDTYWIEREKRQRKVN